LAAANSSSVSALLVVQLGQLPDLLDRRIQGIRSRLWWRRLGRGGLVWLIGLLFLFLGLRLGRCSAPAGVIRDGSNARGSHRPAATSQRPYVVFVLNVDPEREVYSYYLRAPTDLGPRAGRAPIG
jgi:hypothetical protein